MIGTLFDLLPCPALFIVSAICLAAGFWYGYRHPEGF